MGKGREGTSFTLHCICTSKRRQLYPSLQHLCLRLTPSLALSMLFQPHSLPPPLSLSVLFQPPFSHFSLYPLLPLLPPPRPLHIQTLPYTHPHLTPTVTCLESSSRTSCVGHTKTTPENAGSPRPLPLRPPPLFPSPALDVDAASTQCSMPSARGR